MDSPLTKPRQRHATTRAIVKAMSIFGSVKALGILCSLVRNKLIAIWVGASGVGLVILYNSIIELIATFSRLNIDQTAMREVARSDRAGIPVIGHVVTRWSVWLGSAGAILMCLLSPLLSQLSFGTMANWWQYCLLATVPFFYAMISAYSTVLQGTREFSRLAKSSLITAVAGIVASVPLIWFLRERSIIWLIVIYALISAFATWALRVRLPRISMPLREVWQRGQSFVRFGVLMTLAIAVTQLLQYIFVIYLNDYASTSDLGLYQAGYTVINSYIGVFFTGIWIEYYPRLSALIHSPQRTRLAVSHEIITCSLIVMPVTAFLIASDLLIIRVLYADSFLPMLPLITIGMAGVTLRASSWCLAHVILARGDGRTYFVTESLSSIVMLALNIAGYRLGGFAGLGIAYVIWYAFYLFIVYYVYRRRYDYTLTSSAKLMIIIASSFAIGCVLAKIYVGWWLVLIAGLATSPIAIKKILT